MDYGSGRDRHGSEQPRLAECMSIPRHEGGGKEEEPGDGEELAGRLRTEQGVF